MFRTRRALEAELLVSKAARRRASVHRDPNWSELIFGITAFIAVAGATLYVIAWLGH